MKNKLVGLDLHACYGATKAAVINITKTLANEWGKYKLNVNAYHPRWYSSRCQERLGRANAAKMPEADAQTAEKTTEPVEAIELGEMFHYVKKKS